MSDKSLRVYFTTHHDGRLTGQLLPVWETFFDAPPPSAYGTSEAEVSWTDILRCLSTRWVIAAALLAPRGRLKYG